MDVSSWFDPLIAFGWAWKLVKAMIAVVVVIYLSAWLDHRSSVPFRDIIKSFKNPEQYYGLRILGLCLLVALLMGCTPEAKTPSTSVAAEPVKVMRTMPPAPVSAASRFTSRYDSKIAEAVETWWPDYPFPNAWKAQLYQESRLDPGAVSPVGAAGLAQFMPATWAQITREMRLGAVSPHSEIAIEVGAFYMRKLRREWSAPRPAIDRNQLAQASYNAGLGNLLKAQARCGGPPLYPDIIECLPGVTGHHSRETITYVKNIARWWALLEVG